MTTHKTTLSLVVAACTVLPAALAQPTDGSAVRDRERIIDVTALQQAMQNATKPVTDRMASSNLKSRFERVREILSEDDVNKEELVDALRALHADMTGFTEDFDECVRPLWEGQEAIAKTIDRVRTLMAEGASGGSSEKTQTLLTNYDARLRDLAQQVEAEKDPARRQRLKLVFSNVLALKKLVENSGSVDLSPAAQALQLRIVRALDALSQSLTMTTFEVEKVRVILTDQAEFVSNYVAIIEGMIDAETLAKSLADMRATGEGVAGLAMNVNELQKQATEFATMMNGFADKLAASIEKETDKLAEQVEVPEAFAGIDVDAEIRRYAQSGTQSQTVAAAQDKEN